MKHLTLALLFCISSFGLSAQSSLFEAGLFLGGASIGGDLVKSNFGSVNEINLAYGVRIRRYVTPNVAIRVAGTLTKLTSQAQQFDNFGSQTVRSETSLTEISVDGEYDFLGHRRNWLVKSGGVSPYAFLGFGFGITDPKLIYDSEDELLKADENADYSRTRIVVPFGVGARWAFSKSGSLCLEIGARPTFSDYLDGISLAGNPKRNDWYGFFGIELWYTLSDK